MDSLLFDMSPLTPSPSTLADDPAIDLHLDTPFVWSDHRLIDDAAIAPGGCASATSQAISATPLRFAASALGDLGGPAIRYPGVIIMDRFEIREVDPPHRLILPRPLFDSLSTTGAINEPVPYLITGDIIVPHEEEVERHLVHDLPNGTNWHPRSFLFETFFRIVDDDAWLPRELDWQVVKHEGRNPRVSKCVVRVECIAESQPDGYYGAAFAQGRSYLAGWTSTNIYVLWRPSFRTLHAWQVWLARPEADVFGETHSGEGYRRWEVPESEAARRVAEAAKAAEDARSGRGGWSTASLAAAGWGPLQPDPTGWLAVAQDSTSSRSTSPSPGDGDGSAQHDDSHGDYLASPIMGPSGSSRGPCTRCTLQSPHE